MDEIAGRNKILLHAWESFFLDTPDMIYFKDTQLTYVGASRAFAEEVGCKAPEDVIGKTDFELFPDAELARRYTDDDKMLLSSGCPLEAYIEPLPMRGGRPRYCLTTKALIRDQEGKTIGVYGVSRDITLEYESRLNYDRELKYLLSLAPNAYAAVLFDVTDWRMCDYRSQSVREQTVPLQDTVEANIQNEAEAAVEDEAAHGFFRSFSKCALEEAYGSGKTRLTMEYLRKMQDGEQRWVRDELRFLFDPITRHLNAVFIIYDIDEYKRRQDALLRAAEQDSMTDLLNHDATLRHVEQYLQDEGQCGTHALFMVDVDNFKQINDTYGHGVGDRVLTKIAEAIGGVFRETDIIGRVGGDEFLILMKNAGRRKAVEKKAQELIDAMRTAGWDSEPEKRPTGSVGATVFRSEAQSIDTLYAEVDEALYLAKSAGKNRYVVSGDVAEEL